MGLPQENSGITTPIPRKKDAPTTILSFLLQSKFIVEKHIVGITPSLSQMVIGMLCYLSIKPMACRTRISKDLGYGRDVSKRLIFTMESIGFVEIVKKPRKILPFNAYKIDKGYRITAKGISVLKELFED